MSARAPLGSSARTRALGATALGAMLLGLVSVACNSEGDADGVDASGGAAGASDRGGSDAGGEPVGSGGDGGPSGGSLGSPGGSGGTPPGEPAPDYEPVYTASGLSFPTSIAVDSEWVYVGFGSGIYSAPKDGSGELELLQEGRVESLAVLGDVLLYTDLSELMSMPLGGGATTKFTQSAAGRVPADKIVVVGEDAFAAKTFSPCGATFVESVYSLTLASHRGAPVVSAACLKEFTADETHVYFGVGSYGSVAGSVSRVLHAGGEPEVIVEDVDVTYGMAVHNGEIFFGAGDGEGLIGSLLKAPITGGVAETVETLGIEGGAWSFDGRLVVNRGYVISEWTGSSFEQLASAPPIVKDVAADDSHVYFVSGTSAPLIGKALF